MKQAEEILLDSKTIQKKVKELAAEINRDYEGKELLLICVLKGAAVFLADLMRSLTIELSVDFIAVSSYGSSTRSSGIVRILKDLESSIEGKHCLLVEDIVDSGLTLQYLHKMLLSRCPASLKIVTLLDKPERREAEITPDYVGFVIPDKFVVGYGLDVEERFRQLPEIRTVN